MNSGFADPKLLCGGTDGGPVLYDVKSQALSPVLHVSLQTIHSPPCGGSVYAGSGQNINGMTFFKDVYQAEIPRQSPCEPAAATGQDGHTVCAEKAYERQRLCCFWACGWSDNSTHGQGEDLSVRAD